MNTKTKAAIGAGIAATILAGWLILKPDVAQVLTPCTDPNFLQVHSQAKAGMDLVGVAGFQYNGVDSRISMSNSTGTFFYNGACHETPYNLCTPCIARAVCNSFSASRKTEFWDAQQLYGRWWLKGQQALLSPENYVNSGLANIYATVVAQGGIPASRLYPRTDLGNNQFVVDDYVPYVPPECAGGPVPTPEPSVTPDPTEPTPLPEPTAAPPPTPVFTGCGVTSTLGFCVDPATMQPVNDPRCVPDARAGVPCTLGAGPSPTNTRTPVPGPAATRTPTPGGCPTPPLMVCVTVTPTP